MSIKLKNPLCSSLTPSQVQLLTKALELRKAAASRKIKKEPLKAAIHNVDSVQAPSKAPTKALSIKAKTELYQSLFSSNEEIESIVQTAESSPEAKPLKKELSPSYLKSKTRAQAQQAELERIGRRILYDLSGHKSKPPLTKFELSVLEDVREALSLIETAIKTPTKGKTHV